MNRQSRQLTFKSDGEEDRLRRNELGIGITDMQELELTIAHAAKTSAAKA